MEVVVSGLRCARSFGSQQPSVAAGHEVAVSEVTVELWCSPYAAVCGLEVL